MSDLGASIETDAAIPHIHHREEADEGMRAFMSRVALATDFAYAIDVAQFDRQPTFTFEAVGILLPSGTLIRSLASGAIRAVRDSALVNRSMVDVLFIYVLLSGRLTLRSGQRRLRIEPGELIVHDLTQPAEVLLEGYETLTLVVGRAALPPETRERALHGVVGRRGNPVVGIVTTMLQQLHAGARQLRPEAGRVVLDHAIALLSDVLAESTIKARLPVPVRAAAEAVIEDRLDDPALCPDAVAEELGVSRATLYRAFRSYGGVRHLIADRRLGRAWSLITSSGEPAPRTIARACGFTSVETFEAQFAARFGFRPRDLASASSEERTAMLGSARMLVDAEWQRVTHAGCPT